MTTRAALIWSAVWISMAMVFNGWIWHQFGAKPAEEFFTGYLLEKSLSVDNLFVFVLVFAFFRTPLHEQHRVLVWGIVGAMILRAVMILSGAALIERFEFVEAIFGAFLLFSGIKLLFHDDEADPSDSRMVRFFQRTLPLTDGYRGHKFFVREDGKLKCTHLFLVLLVIEGSDVVFAVDSVPAIFGVTRDPFIVFTSNMFAILGLRALYFVIAKAIQRLRYLNYGLALILAFIGVKMLVPFIPAGLRAVGIETTLDGDHMHLDVRVSLLIICAVLVITTVISLVKAPPGSSQEGAALPEAPPGAEGLAADPAPEALAGEGVTEGAADDTNRGSDA